LATASGAGLPVPDLDQRIADAVAVGHPAEIP
jgi:hypothetical protein